MDLIPLLHCLSWWESAFPKQGSLEGKLKALVKSFQPSPIVTGSLNRKILCVCTNANPFQRLLILGKGSAVIHKNWDVCGYHCHDPKSKLIMGLQSFGSSWYWMQRSWENSRSYHAPCEAGSFRLYAKKSNSQEAYKRMMSWAWGCSSRIHFIYIYKAPTLC